MLNDKKKMRVEMSEKAESSGVLSFKRLNYLFWVIWVCVPILFYKLWTVLNDPATYTQGLTPEQANCMKDIVNPGTFSPLGTALYNLPLMSAFVFYCVLIFSFHRMVFRFAKGGAFDSFTLRHMKILGYTLMIYPFFEFILSHAVSAGLVYTGDTKLSNGVAFVDIGVVSAGFFVIALMMVLRDAIDFKSENDLTI
jgi:Protein of unknown function (DUF2975)